MRTVGLWLLLQALQVQVHRGGDGIGGSLRPARTAYGPQAQWEVPHVRGRLRRLSEALELGGDSGVFRQRQRGFLDSGLGDRRRHDREEARTYCD